MKIETIIKACVLATPVGMVLLGLIAVVSAWAASPSGNQFAYAATLDAMGIVIAIWGLATFALIFLLGMTSD